MKTIEIISMKINQKRYFYFALIAFYIFLHSEFIHAQNKSLKQENITNQEELSVFPEKVAHINLSLFYVLNYFKSNKYYSEFVPDNLPVTSSGKPFWAPNLNLEYVSAKNLGIGIGLNGIKNTFSAERILGRKYTPASCILFIFFCIPSPASEKTYRDAIQIDIKGSEYSIYGIYQFVRYSKNKHQPFEISFRAGLSISDISESQYLTVSIVKDTINSLGARYRYYNSNSTSYYSAGIIWSAFVNVRCLIHLSRKFSLILADITQNFCLISPTVQETSVTVDNNKTLTFRKHKLNSTAFSLFPIGFTLHF